MIEFQTYSVPTGCYLLPLETVYFYILLPITKAMEQVLINRLWIIGCSILVFLMQAGFLCLEAGATRRKNSINVALKNITDFAVSVLLFWVVGYGLMFGSTANG